MYKTEAIGKVSKEAPFEKITIGREGTSNNDVEIDVKYCGFCHTDIHLVNNDWGFTTFPSVGGHEVILQISIFFNLYSPIVSSCIEYHS